MSEWLQSVQTAVPTVVTLVGLFFLISGKYFGLQHSRLLVRSKKRTRLDALIASGKWKTVSAIELELAVWDAFGFEMDARMVRYAFSRRRALEHLRYLKKCEPMLKLGDSGVLMPLRRQRVGFLGQATSVFALSFVPFVVIYFLSPYLKANFSIGGLGILSGIAFAWMIWMMWVTLGLVTAYRLTNEATRYYPPDDAKPLNPAGTSNLDAQTESANGIKLAAV